MMSPTPKRPRRRTRSRRRRPRPSSRSSELGVERYFAAALAEMTCVWELDEPNAEAAAAADALAEGPPDAKLAVV